MAKVVVKSKVKKAKRKFPVQIVAPEYLNSQNVGNSQVTDLASMVGKTAKMNLMYVTGSMKNQNIRLTFRVTEVASGVAKTTVSIYEQIAYYLGRHVKSRSTLIEDSFVATTKDNKEVRIKPFIVTKSNVTQLIAAALRAQTIDLIKKELEQRTYDEFMSSVIFGKVQNQFRNDLKKVVPLKAFELKKVELLQ